MFHGHVVACLLLRRLVLLQHWLWFVHSCGYRVYIGSIKTTICKAYVPYNLARSGQQLLTGGIPEVKRALGLDLHYLLGCSYGWLNGHRATSTCVTLLLLKSKIKAVIHRTYLMRCFSHELISKASTWRKDCVNLPQMKWNGVASWHPLDMSISIWATLIYDFNQMAHHFYWPNFACSSVLITN